MIFSNEPIEKQLLRSQAGRSVYDSLVQANVDPNKVSVEMVKQMLVAELRHQSRWNATSPRELVLC